MSDTGKTTTRPGPSAALARFIQDFRFESIPAEVRERIKLLILDSLGCGLYGASLDWSHILIDTLARLDRTSECRVWGTRHRLSAPHAVLVNGTLIQSFELDDIHTKGLLHVGCAVLPPLFALAESGLQISGQDFMRAAVIGYEIGPRVGFCMGQDHLVQGWHASATLGVFAAVSAAAAALRLPASQALHALGIAGTQASGLMAAQFGSMVKRMHAGRSAQSGFYAAVLAQAGFTGIENIFEAEYGGFCSTFAGPTGKFKLEELTAGLGERYETMNDAIKFYACAASNHSALDAIRNIRARRPFAPDDVARIVVHGSEAMMKHVYWKYKPDSLTTAQFNMPFVLATYILEGEFSGQQLSEAAIRDPARIALADRVDFVLDAEATAGGAARRHWAKVEMHFKDGTVEQETVAAQRGSPSRFPDGREVVDKFMKLASRVIPMRQAEQISEAVLMLERSDDARSLAVLLGKA
ncbi:MAG TPA: MmgE/PrpD family protein [Dongiaceae bacterium]|nr:MmgE/PrpD family protein [Dongiaceae bacterium]